MKFQSKYIFSDQTALEFEAHFRDLTESLTGITDSKISAFFTQRGMGARSKSLAGTIRFLVTQDLQLKGWTTNWTPFSGHRQFETAMWKFDAAKKIAHNGGEAWVTLEISFDNRLALGTHLVKAQVANNKTFRADEGLDPIIHHCIIAGSKLFKESAGLDGSVASSEEFDQASSAYSLLEMVPTTLISILPLETLEVSQRKSDGRTKSKLLVLQPSTDS